jgi:hypothetical protein
MDCKCRGSLTDARKVGGQQRKAKVGEASSSITVNENVRLQLAYEWIRHCPDKSQTHSSQVPVNDIVGVNYKGRVMAPGKGHRD